MTETDELRQQIAQLENDLAAQNQKLAELEAWVIVRLDQQERRAARVRGIVQTVQDNAAVAIGLIGLAIALWGASPEARQKATDTWINSTVAASLGAIAVVIQRKKPE